MVFEFISDPGHAWLKVEWTELKALGLNPTDFSQCSYRKRNTFYLEEDCDAPKFIKAWTEKHGKKPGFVERLIDHDCFIRSLPSIY